VSVLLSVALARPSFLLMAHVLCPGLFKGCVEIYIIIQTLLTEVNDI